MTRPPVIITTTFYSPVLGGAEAAAQRLAVYLHRRGHRVLVLTKRTSRALPAQETIDGVDVLRLPPAAERSGRGKWTVLPSMFAALLRHRARGAVVCCIDYRGIGLAALAARVFTHVPVIFQAQTDGVIGGARIRERLARFGMSPNGSLAKMFASAVRGLYGRADAIGCISNGIVRETVDAGVPSERVHYLPNPVQSACFTPLSPEARRVVRAHAGIPPDAVVALYVGRLSKEKGALELVQAWAHEKPDGYLVIIGPPMTDHPWDVSAAISAVVEREGLSGRVRLLGGQPSSVVADWLRSADFAVQPSYFEAMGLAAAEEMAAGLPVIASDIGGFRDFIVHERNGLLVPVGDVSGIGQAVGRLMTDAACRARLAAAARTAAAPFDEAIVLERFAGLIDRLARAR